MLQKIISGGQTGADRAALDAALDAGFPAGGFCPAGRLAEDGAIPLRYPLEEIPAGYCQRTKRNVEASDGTAVFYHSILTGGTERTVVYCRKCHKPCKLFDIDMVDVGLAVEKLAEFVIRQNIRVLNVAGPRSSQCPQVYDFVRAATSLLIRRFRPSERGCG